MTIDHPKTGETPALRRLWQEAFGDTEEFLDLFFSVAYDPARCRRILDRTVAAALYWFDCETDGRKIAYLYAVATAEQHRGRGLCRTLMADVHDLLAQQGYAGAILVPGTAALFRFYEKLGYKTCASLGEYSWTAGEKPATLQPVDAARYAILRRQLLPAGAVLQERENLAFLAALGRFYTGPGLAVWAAKDPEGNITGELLGDLSQGPGVVKALGANKGTFRSPVGHRAFAMYHGFDGGAAPSYLGFAFD